MLQFNKTIKKYNNKLYNHSLTKNNKIKYHNNKIYKYNLNYKIILINLKKTKMKFNNKIFKILINNN